MVAANCLLNAGIAWLEVLESTLVSRAIKYCRYEGS